jgi:hypothetical protein
MKHYGCAENYLHAFPSQHKHQNEKNNMQKKPFSGLTSPNKLFFYLFCIAGFCYQPNRQIVANFVMV